MLTKIVWITISFIAAASLSVVVGIVNPSEKINALWLVVAAGCFFAVSYRFYASFLTAKVLAIDGKRTTPAERLLRRYRLPSDKTVGYCSAITLPL